MNALILAAGYATRLYPLTQSFPKPLLQIGSKSIIDYIIKGLHKISELKNIWVVTNHTFFRHFQDWRKSHSDKTKVEIVDDGTQTPEDRLGAVRDMDFVIQKEKINSDLLVVGGDNLFEFDLRNFAVQGQSHKPYPTMGVYDVGSKTIAKRFGVVTLDSKGKVAHFVEKPIHPHSTLVAMCLYYFPKESLPWIRCYLDSGENADAPGHYLSWLAREESVYGYLFEGDWVDIGDLKVYKETQSRYSQKESKKGVKDNG